MVPDNPRELSLLIDTAEAQSWFTVYRHCPQGFADQYGITCDETEDADLFFAPGIDVLAFNRALNLGMKSNTSTQAIENIIARFKAAGVRRFFVQITPHAQPSDIEEMLVSAGFRHYNNWAKWYKPLERREDEGRAVDILKISGSMAHVFGDIVIAGFNFDPYIAPLVAAGVGLEGWEHFIASIDGTVAGCAAGYRYGDVCTLGWAATREEFRNHGVQNALIHHRLNWFRERGCMLAALETAEDTPEHSAPSYRNMQRNGFTLAYLRKNYIYVFE